MESLSKQMLTTADFFYKEWVSTCHAFCVHLVKYGV